ncbi:hypothetical protein ACFYRC_33630 [Streptomyces sp. NPDC005279]|uniref:hypothetical protein n=1 Tax=Streptomyces sp. NPDC005279 TaxID=3364712 RepID=UPI0036B2C7C1
MPVSAASILLVNPGGPGGPGLPSSTRPHPVPAGSGELAQLAIAGFYVEAAAAAQHPARALLPQEADEGGVTTLVWHRRHPFHPERLYQALEDLCCAAYLPRATGRAAPAPAHQ